MTELLFCMMLCAITVQWSFTALRRGREGERDKDRQRERESMCVCKKSGTGASSPHPYCCCLQSEECCISWGQCRGQGRGGSLQLRSPYRKHRAGLQTQRACGRRRNWEGQRRREGGRWTDREKDRETDELQHSAWCLLYPMFSTKKFSFTPSEDRSGNESFSHPKNCAHGFQFHCSIVLWLFYDWMCLFVRCFRVTALDSRRYLI